MFPVKQKLYNEFSELEKKKANCRSITHYFVEIGVLVKPDKCNCGNYPVEAHHTDYDNPKLVEWLCRDCHRRLHKKQRSTACSCGCGKEIEPERIASGQHYTKDCHNAYMRRYRAHQKLRIESMKAELKQLRNER